MYTFKNGETIETLNMPTYEDMKAAFIDAIRFQGIWNSEEYLNELFNSCDNLNEPGIIQEGGIYEIEHIMMNINSDNHDHCLYTEMPLDVTLACKLIKELNPTCQEFKENDCLEFLDEISCSDIYYDIAENFWYRFLDETTVGEFKELILKIKRENWRGNQYKK